MRKLYILFTFSLLLSACDLDREPYGVSDYWNTEEDVMMGLNAAYAPLYEEEGFGRGQFWLGGASDDMLTNRPIAEVISVTNFETMVNASGNVYNNWQLMYEVIRRCNDVMKHTELVNMTAKNKDIALGEANFLSAFSYFFLAKRYGGVPFYDYKKPEEINKKRETLTETYTRIVAYLEIAIAHFEAQQLWKRSDSEWGRPNLGAAYTLLAKVYAYWGKYDKCKEYTSKVVGHYTLDTTNNNGYAHLFSPKGETHEEVLFNLTCNAVRHEGTVTSVILLSNMLSDGTGWGYFAPTKSLYDAYEKTDTRRDVTIVGAGSTVNYLGKKVKITEKQMADMQTGYMCAKYAAAYEGLTSWQWESGADIPLLRYSDALLLDAEADIFLAGGGPGNRTQGVPAAAKSFNEVRLRAFGGDASKKKSSPTFNDLMNERRCELAYEDDRHFDLVRWGLAKEVYNNSATNDPRGARNFDPQKNAYFPLPQKEIENSDNLLVNNPLKGYSSFE